MTSRLMSALTARERMDALKDFLNEWYGPWRPEYGILESELSHISMPAPLRQLYQFAGRWPANSGKDGTRGNFMSKQDVLLLPEELKTEGEKLIFLIENQCVWRCATELSGEDPPIFLEESINDDPKSSIPLSEALVTFVLQEAMFTSNYCDTGKKITKEVIAQMGIPVLWRGMYVCPEAPYDFYDIGNGRIAAFMGSIEEPFVAVNSAGMSSFLPAT